jgi:hypothetical protein
VLSQKEIFVESWKARLVYLPATLAVGIGLSINNAKAVIEALVGHQSAFARTPKYRVETSRDRWKQKRYCGVIPSLIPMIELSFGIYFTFVAYYAATHGIYGTLPFIVLFQIGYLYTASLSLFESYLRPFFASAQAA